MSGRAVELPTQQLNCTPATPDMPLRLASTVSLLKPLALVHVWSGTWTLVSHSMIARQFTFAVMRRATGETRPRFHHIGTSELSAVLLPMSTRKEGRSKAPTLWRVQIRLRAPCLLRPSRLLPIHVGRSGWKRRQRGRRIIAPARTVNV